MSEHEPDYTTLSLAELLDVERHIDRNVVPDRWARLQAALTARRSGISPIEPRRAATQPIDRVLFTLMHMFMTVTLLVIAFVAFPGQGGESAVARDLSLFLVVPAAFFVSAGSILVHKFFLRARRPVLFLLLSLFITPLASMAVLVLVSSILFLLSTLLSR